VFIKVQTLFYCKRTVQWLNLAAINIMNSRYLTVGLFLGLLSGGVCPLFGADASVRPVTANASPEAVDLLQYLHDISGKHTLAGQHCNPLVGSTRLVTVYRQTKHYPAVFGQDFGFDAPGSWDGINFRQQIVDEAIRRHQEGFIIVLMWHAVRPTEDEPVTFKESVQGKLTDKEWQDLITPGTEINERWKSQVDVIAWFLKQLQYAGVPVLWRPYHEMNGDWFWWGKKAGDNGYKKLYRMLYDRLVHFHRLNNLIWVYGPNELNDNVDSYEKYYPGNDVVDVLATDVYHRGFAQRDYDELQALAGDKPIALGEVGSPPSVEILRSQPKWTWFMVWGDLGGFGRGGTNPLATYQCEQVLTLEKLPWVKLGEPKIHYPILK
jgi:mannan endo-1,4-beta-mannosidase